MTPAGFEPAFPAGDRPQTLVLDRSAAGIGLIDIQLVQVMLHVSFVMSHRQVVQYTEQITNKQPTDQPQN
jgi:hypothetical protein